MSKGQIFISYRRADSAGYARAVYDALARQFGAARVFIDVDDIPAGMSFGEVITRAVGESEVLLVLIGKSWLAAPADGQGARLHDPTDLVRREVATALASGVRVIPLLVDGAAMPDPGQLPEDLRPLCGRNALEIGNSRFAADLERLATTLRQGFGEAPAPPPSAATTPARLPRRALVMASLAALAAAAGLALWSRRRLPEASADATATGPAAAAAAVRPPANGTWTADVSYDWPGANYQERFEFGGDAGELSGSASFLGVPRGLVDGRVDPGGQLRFVTRSAEVAGSGAAEPTEHRYQGRLAGDELQLVMQTVGGVSAHVPVKLVARRVVAAAPAAGASSGR